MINPRGVLSGGELKALPQARLSRLLKPAIKANYANYADYERLYTIVGHVDQLLLTNAFTNRSADVDPDPHFPVPNPHPTPPDEQLKLKSKKWIPRYVSAGVGEEGRGKGKGVGVGF